MTSFAALVGISIVDIVIVGLVVWGVIFGFIRGFTASFERGCLGKIIVLGLAAFCAFVLSFGIGGIKPALESIPQYNALTDKVVEMAIKPDSNLFNPARVEDGKLLITVEGEDKTISALIAGTEVATADDIVGKVITAKALENNAAEDGTQSVGAIFSNLIKKAIGFLGVFIVMTIIFTIANLVLSKLFRKTQEPDENGKAPLKMADRLVGSATMAVLFAVFVFGIMLVLYLVSGTGKIEAVTQQIDASTIGKLIFNLFAKLFG